ncbi:phosphotransferase [Microbacterium halophytorum]|uniref:phosphotransferase n=1 Tax=Microbacterium halophytorum TaxID=2067568 RepID=UPI000CFD7F61|nr:phosphotransferase [Microbacterium halophytorum]
MSEEVPAAVEVEGREWAIARAWPAEVGAETPIEARRDREARGGYWSAAGGARLLPAGADPRLPALAAVARAGRVISHRPGKRAVVRLDDGGAFAKVVRPGRAGGVAQAHASAELFAGAMRVPRIVPHGFAARDVVCFSPLGGTTFAELGASGGVAQWAAAWRGWERAWSTAVGSADASGLPAHSTEDEAGVLLEWAGRADALVGRSDRMRSAAGAVADELAAVAGAPGALAHRDLHDKQLLWSPEGGVGLIDLDTCARADPALDLGNLAAHIGLAVRLGTWAPDRARVALASVEAAAAALDVSQRRLSAWRLAARFRIDCVHLLRPGSRRAAHDDLERLVRLAERESGRVGMPARERRALA